MKKSLLLLLALCVYTVSCAQKQKNYRPFVKDLNKMLKGAEEFSWMYEPDFEVVEPYRIKSDTLSVTIRGLVDGKPVTHKYEAAMPDVKDFVHDLYFVLSFNNKSVRISELQHNKWVVVDNRDFLHLGRVSDEDSEEWAKKLSDRLNLLFPLENEFKYWE